MRLLYILILLMLFPASFSFGFSTRDDCSKCHTLKKEEALELLKSVSQGQKLTVLDVRVSPMKALWEVDIESEGKKSLAYIDFTKKYLFSGSMIDMKSKKNLTQERYSELNKVDVSQIPLGDALVMGSRDAKNKVIVFDDPD